MDNTDHREGMESFKDCCLSCTLGIVVASMGQKCSGVSTIFGCPLEKPFNECCEEIAAPLNLNYTDDFEFTTDNDFFMTEETTEVEESTEDSDNNDDICPLGFQYNSDLHVCDDIDEVGGLLVYYGFIESLT